MKLSQVIATIRQHKGPAVVWCPALQCAMDLPINKAAAVRELERNLHWLKDHDTGWTVELYGDTLVIDTAAATRSMT